MISMEILYFIFGSPSILKKWMIPLYIPKIYKYFKLLYTFNSKFYYSNLYRLLCELHVTASQPWLLLQSSGKFKILTTGFHHQNFWFNWIWVWSKHENFKKHSGGSSVCPRLTTTDPSQASLSKVTFMPWVLTLFMDKCWRSKRDHSSKGGDMRTLMW